MPKSISTPLQKTVPLTKFDESGDTHVIVRQARQSEVEYVASASMGYTRQITDPETGAQISVRYPASRQEIMRRRVEAVLCGCNILDTNGQPLFRFADLPDGRRAVSMETAPTFAEQWGKLEPELAREIYEAVLQVNPMWSNLGEG